MRAALPASPVLKETTRVAPLIVAGKVGVGGEKNGEKGGIREDQ